MNVLGFEKAVRTATGKTVKELRNTPLENLRAAVEAERGQRTRYSKRFPDIGRGNVLRDLTVSHEDAETAFAEAIKDG